MPVPQEKSFFVERASCPFLTMVQDISSYYASTKILLTNSRKHWRNRLQSSTAKALATGYHARSFKGRQKPLPYILDEERL